MGAQAGMPGEPVREPSTRSPIEHVGLAGLLTRFSAERLPGLNQWHHAPHPFAKLTAAGTAPDLHTVFPFNALSSMDERMILMAIFLQK